MDTDRLARTLARLRPLLTAVLLVGLVVCALLALRPLPEGVVVLVATHALEEGAALEREDLREVRVPPEALPEDAWPVGAELPATWSGAPLPAGTILSESNVAGSAESRGLSPGEARLMLTVPLDQAIGLEVGDTVDIWSSPQMCDGSGCAASLLAEAVRLTSMVVDEDSSWGNSPTARVGLVLRAVDTGRVLGHTGAGTLSLVLRP
jgi:SAF domain.